MSLSLLLLQRDMWLPTEVWAVVAEILVGDAEVSTLAQLNVVNQEIHHGTLPVLFETVKFKTVDKFERSVRLSSPRAWMYTRYVRRLLAFQGSQTLRATIAGFCLLMRRYIPSYAFTSDTAAS